MRLFLVLLFTVHCLLLTLCLAQDASVARWEVRMDRPAPQTLEIRRGETVDLQPTYLTFEAPFNMTNIVAVEFRYAAMGWTDYHAITGSVQSVTGGVVTIRWTPAAAATNSLYSYEIALSTLSNKIIRAYGPLKLIPSLFAP